MKLLEHRLAMPFLFLTIFILSGLGYWGYRYLAAQDSAVQYTRLCFFESTGPNSSRVLYLEPGNCRSVENATGVRRIKKMDLTDDALKKILFLPGEPSAEYEESSTSLSDSVKYVTLHTSPTDSVFLTLHNAKQYNKALDTLLTRIKPML